MNQNPTFNLKDFEISGNPRPSWIKFNRAEGLLDHAVIRSIVGDGNSAKICAALPGSGLLRHFKDLYAKNMASLSPSSVTRWHQNYVLAFSKLLQLLSLKAQYLSLKELKKELKKLRAEMQAIEKRHQSEQQSIEALNQWLEEQRNLAQQQVATVENKSQPKNTPKTDGNKISKQLLAKLLGILGLTLGANSQNIRDAYQKLCEDRQKNPEKYSEEKWPKIEESFGILSELDDNELDQIAHSDNQLTETEGEFFLEKLGLDPNGNYTVKEIDDAYLAFSVDHALKSGAAEPDPVMQKLYQNFVNQTDEMKPEQRVNLQTLTQELQLTLAFKMK